MGSSLTAIGTRNMPNSGQVSRKRRGRVTGRKLLKLLLKQRPPEVVTLNSGAIARVPNPVFGGQRESATEPGWGQYLFQRILDRLREKETKEKRAGKLTRRISITDLHLEFDISQRTLNRLKRSTDRPRQVKIAQKDKTLFTLQGSSGVRLRIELARRILLIGLSHQWITPDDVAAPWVKLIEYQADLEAMKSIRRRMYKDDAHLMGDLLKVLERKYRLVQHRQRMVAARIYGANLVALLPVI